MSRLATLFLCLSVWTTFLVQPGALGEEPAKDDPKAHNPPPLKTPQTPADVAKVASLIVDETNAFRKEQGLEPLAENPKLTATAEEFAAYMADEDKYSHTADGREPAERVAEHDYEYCLIMENIAYQFRDRGFDAGTLADVLAMNWKNSPEHRTNMLDADVTEIGAALAQSRTTGYYYAVQLFGRPKSERITFEISNRSDATVRYKIDDEEFSLTPRFTRTHFYCRQGTISFQWSKDDVQAVRFRTNSRFIVARDGKGRLQAKSTAK